jgi:outer membrane protein OmpA-like peptidoglycan-associated protein
MCRFFSVRKSLILVFIATFSAEAQDTLPRDNGIYGYHTAPEYRESESNPLRVAAYIVHPIGWVLREVITRPLSYFASSTEVTRSVMGYRYPFDYRNPECFSSDGAIPDCRQISPFLNKQSNDSDAVSVTQVYFPNVNFDFDKRSLNTLGQGMVTRIAQSLQQETEVKVVLQGHADYVGSEQYNDVLGMDRAKAVKSELLKLGISEARLSTVSFGETVPLVDEQTPQARAVNRRVEVMVDKSQS